MGVRACIDVRIDAQRNPRAHAPRARRAVDALQLARRLGVDGFQSELHGPLDLVRRFPDAAEDDVLGRESGAHRQLDLADRIGVDRAAGLAQQPHDAPATSSPSWHSESGADGPRMPRRARGRHSESTRRCRRRGASRERVPYPRAKRRRKPAHFLCERSQPRRRSYIEPNPQSQSLISIHVPVSIEATIQLAADGDQAAWDTIVGDVLAEGLQRRVPVRRHVRRSGRSRRRRSSSRSFARSSTFDRRANFQTWLISVSRNFCIDRYRSGAARSRGIRAGDRRVDVAGRSARTERARARRAAGPRRAAARGAARAVAAASHGRAAARHPRAVVPGNRRPARRRRGNGEVADQPRTRGAGATDRGASRGQKEVEPRAGALMNVTCEQSGDVASCTRHPRG